MNRFLDNDDLVFAAETPIVNGSPASGDYWKVLVVDDDDDDDADTGKRSVHAVTRYVLKDVHFENRSLQLIDASSAKQAKDLIKENQDIAVILLDIVMENEDAGLEVVRYVREELGNTLVRIIIRTAQPGSAPEHEVIREYDINGYFEKPDVTSKRLETAVVCALRDYCGRLSLVAERQGMLSIINSVPALFRSQSEIAVFAKSLSMIALVLTANYPDPSKAESQDLKFDSFLCKHIPGGQSVVCGTGKYKNYKSESLDDVAPPLVKNKVAAALSAKDDIFFNNGCVLYVATQETHPYLMYLGGSTGFDETQRSLLGLIGVLVAEALGKSSMSRLDYN